MMKVVLRNKVIGVAVELMEDEARYLDYWWSNRTKHGNEIADFEKFQAGERVIIEMLKHYREGFHKDGD
jgi:hypothetical protein